MPRARVDRHDLPIHDANTLQQPDKNVVQYHTTSLPAGTQRTTVPVHTIAILQVALAK